MIVEVADSQEEEVGDGTTTAAVLAGNLLGEAGTSSSRTFTRRLSSRATTKPARSPSRRSPSRSTRPTSTTKSSDRSPNRA